MLLRRELGISLFPPCLTICSVHIPTKRLLPQTFEGCIKIRPDLPVFLESYVVLGIFWKFCDWIGNPLEFCDWIGNFLSFGCRQDPRVSRQRPCGLAHVGLGSGAPSRPRVPRQPGDTSPSTAHLHPVRLLLTSWPIRPGSAKLL